MAEKRINILITGARGFIGKNLVEHLSSDKTKPYVIFSPFHKELDLLDTDAVAKYIQDHSINCIIHGANVGGSRKTAYDSGSTDVVSRNMRMFFNLARHMPMINKFIMLGSGAEYDRAHYKPKMSEDYFDEHVPTDDYGFSKYMISKYIENGDKMVNLRLFGVFGKYEDHEFKFISNSIIKNLLDLPITINQNINFDYLYINDCVNVIEKFISLKPKHRAYNLTTGTTIDLVTIAERIIKLSGKISEIIVKNPGFNIEYSGDNSRLMKEIKYAFTPIDKALNELIEYYTKILPTIDRKSIETDEFLKHCKTKG